MKSKTCFCFISKTWTAYIKYKQFTVLLFVQYNYFFYVDKAINKSKSFFQDDDSPSLTSLKNKMFIITIQKNKNGGITSENWDSTGVVYDTVIS